MSNVGWQVQLGNVVLPKSVTPARIRENLDIFDFSLAADAMVAISALDDDPGEPASRMSEAVELMPSWTA